MVQPFVAKLFPVLKLRSTKGQVWAEEPECGLGELRPGCVCVHSVGNQAGAGPVSLRMPVVRESEKVKGTIHKALK